MDKVFGLFFFFAFLVLRKEKKKVSLICFGISGIVIWYTDLLFAGFNEIKRNKN